MSKPQRMQDGTCSPLEPGIPQRLSCWKLHQILPNSSTLMILQHSPSSQTLWLIDFVEHFPTSHNVVLSAKVFVFVEVVIVLHANSPISASKVNALNQLQVPALLLPLFAINHSQMEAYVPSILVIPTQEVAQSSKRIAQSTALTVVTTLLVIPLKDAPTLTDALHNKTSLEPTLPPSASAAIAQLELVSQLLSNAQHQLLVKPVLVMIL